MDGASRMDAASPLARPVPRWSAAAATGMSEAELLVFRSNLLGADLGVTNFGGGNTSAKLDDADPITGAAIRVLWVKGSGGDLGSIHADGFSRLRLQTLDAMRPRFGSPADEDLMPALYPYAAVEPAGRAPSIDTPLHALLPFRHVDHVHPDAVIALAAARAASRQRARSMATTSAGRPGCAPVTSWRCGCRRWSRRSRACAARSWPATG